MTYYEWIDYLDKLKHNAITDNDVNKIDQANLTYTGDIKIRFLNHIVDLINYRLNASVDNFVLKLDRVKQDQNTLLLEIGYIKNEMVFAKKLASVRHFDENTKNSLLQNIHKFGEDINVQIRNAFMNDTNSEIAMIINNLDLNS